MILEVFIIKNIHLNLTSSTPVQPILVQPHGQSHVYQALQPLPIGSFACNSAFFFMPYARIEGVELNNH